MRKFSKSIKANTSGVCSNLSADSDLLQSLPLQLENLRGQIAAGNQRLEDLLALHSFLATGKLPPHFYGWPISPDFGIELINLISRSDYDLIIEFGSGSSTLLIAKANSKRNPGYNGFRHIVFEHLEIYRNKTIALLEKYDLDRSAEIHMSPLVEFEFTGLSEVFHFYDCTDVLRSARRALPAPKAPKLLVVIDGPPGATCPQARFPALPIILEYMSGADIDFFLDDARRQDEQEIIAMWLEHLSGKGVPFESTELKLEKGAYLISLNSFS